MTSTSRNAQQALSELEKSAAAYADQLVEACKFVGITIEALSSFDDEIADTTRSKKRKGSTASHGKEEWLLKWLLRKLQNKKDDVPRTTAGSWTLLRILLQRLSLSTAAKILVERKFVAILQTTLGESQDRPVVGTEASTTDGVTEGSKMSKKRKRKEDPQERTASPNASTGELLRAILSAVDLIAQSTKAGSIVSDEVRGTEYAAEYMRAVLRTGAEDAAKILGDWLSLLKKHDLFATTKQQRWISAFIEIWQLHAADENHLTHFSIYCTLPLLSLRDSLSALPTMSAELEQLVARNIILPAKAAKAANEESTLLADLTKLSIISDSRNAAYLFDVAIRSTQPQISRRRSNVDEAWLQTVFSTLLAAMPRKRAEQNAKALSSMMRSSNDHKVVLNLEVLRAVAQEFALCSPHECEWELLGLTIKLDPNVFLIPVETDQESLLQRIFDKIAVATLHESWSSVEAVVVNDVLIPLMQAFAQARNLVGFIHNWHGQIHRAIKEEISSSPCPWEDSRMLEALKPLLEASLSVHQIRQMLAWLSEQDSSHMEATLVITEAVSAAISSEEYVDAVGVKCYHVIFGKENRIRSDNKYYWRTLRTITNTISFGSTVIKNEIAELWSSNAAPFKQFSSYALGSDNKLVTDSATSFEVWKLASTAWSRAREGSKLQEASKQLVLFMLSSLSSEVAQVQSKYHGITDVGIRQESVALKIKHLLVRTPQIFRLATALGKQDFKNLVESVYKVATGLGVIAAGSSNHNSRLENPWLSVLREDCVLNMPEIIDAIIEVILDSVNRKEGLEHGEDLALRSLLQLPMAVLHRRHRERLMTSWQPSSSSVLSSSVLALKVKVMRFPMFYQGMVFQHLIDYAKSIPNTSAAAQLTQLALLKQLTKMTIEFVLTNIDQARNQNYIEDAFTFASKEAKRMAEKENYTPGVGLIGLCEVVIQILKAHSQVVLDANVIKEKDLKKSASRLETGLLRILLANTTNDLLGVAILDALDSLDVQAGTIQAVRQMTVNESDNIQQVTSVIQDRASLFLASHDTAYVSHDAMSLNCLTVSGRKAVAMRATGFSKSASSAQKMDLLRSSLSNSSRGLAQLLAARHVILASADIRKKSQTKDSDSDSSDSESEDDIFDLSQAYSILCTHLPHSINIRQFLLIIETLTAILRTKPRSITQWNIDATLGAISQICSRNGPSLRSSRASTIYLHLCHLFQAVLLSHRLKLEGHFHLVVQALQSLLRCLFIPLPHSSTKVLKQYTSPPWLSTSAQTYTLTAAHASAFTRLLTLICDPSVSSVTHQSHHKSKTPSLTSQTEKAKRMAGQHMVFVLMSYVRMTLELKMGVGMREKMTPGLYAVFETTSVEGRRALSEALDASGRAVFGGLYRDWVRWGKWKGS